MYEKGGYELSLENAKLVLLSTWYVKGFFGRFVYIYCAVLTFLLGFLEGENKARYGLGRNWVNRAVQGVRVNVNGTEYRPVDFLSIPVVTPFFEEWAWDYLKVNEGDTFVDVGAHIGKYACSVARMVGDDGRVVAIEPHPGNFRALVGNLAANNITNVTALQLAAYDHTCRVELHEGSNSAGRSSLKLDEGNGSVMVDAKPLDEVPELTRLSRIDFVKIDVEGAEYEVVSGMAELLRRHRPRILMEVWGDVGRLSSLLHAIGYDSVTLDPHRKGYYYAS